MQGLCAVVTGSTSGIGAGIARALAMAGAKVMLHGLGDPTAIESQLAQLAADSGGEVLFNGADLSRAEGARELIGEAEARLGAVDVLINNAGIQHVAPVEDFAPEQWDKVIAVNLSAAFHAISAALPGMRRRGRGRIINIASAHGLVASAHKAAYVAAKHGLVGLTKVVALETATSAITCNAICPGWVLTDLVQAQIEERARNEGLGIGEATSRLLGEKQPSQRFTSPEQIAGMVLFLCSPAADNITGAALAMDGGWTAA